VSLQRLDKLVVCAAEHMQLLNVNRLFEGGEPVCLLDVSVHQRLHHAPIIHLDGRARLGKLPGRDLLFVEKHGLPPLVQPGFRDICHQ
jgi:hypothetical protein